MNPQEYKDRLSTLEDEFENKKKELIKECALSNNPYKNGDIVADHIGSIRIEKIMVSLGSDRKPTCVYYGPELKKDLTPRKDGSKRQVWQVNLINNQ